MKSELRKIPGVGPKTEQDLIALGYTTIESLKGQNPEEILLPGLFAEGLPDRPLPAVRLPLRHLFCRNSRAGEAEKLNWWYWKDGAR